MKLFAHLLKPFLKFLLRLHPLNETLLRLKLILELLRVKLILTLSPSLDLLVESVCLLYDPLLHLGQHFPQLLNILLRLTLLLGRLAKNPREQRSMSVLVLLGDLQGRVKPFNHGFGCLPLPGVSLGKGSGLRGHGKVPCRLLPLLGDIRELGFSDEKGVQGGQAGCFSKEG